MTINLAKWTVISHSINSVKMQVRVRVTHHPGDWRLIRQIVVTWLL